MRWLRVLSRRLKADCERRPFLPVPSGRDASLRESVRAQDAATRPAGNGREAVGFYFLKNGAGEANRTPDPNLASVFRIVRRCRGRSGHVFVTLPTHCFYLLLYPSWSEALRRQPAQLVTWLRPGATITFVGKTITLSSARSLNNALMTPSLLTDLALRSLMKSPPDRQTDIPDASSPGLSARVTPKGRVTWSLRLRVAGEGGQSARGRRAKGQQYRLTLGSYPAISIKAARAKAAEFTKQAEAGLHPVPFTPIHPDTPIEAWQWVGIDDHILSAADVERWIAVSQEPRLSLLTAMMRTGRLVNWVPGAFSMRCNWDIGGSWTSGSDSGHLES